MNIVHVAGTKGKGTTCAFTNSILQRYHDTVQVPRKIGLFTSPHLVAVRERIRINSEPISEAKFAQYFFEVWEALEAGMKRDGLDPSTTSKPTYFKMMTLVSFHAFMQEGVDTAIYEVGVGGEYDSTNVVDSPAVTGITTLGIDHTATLGKTIDLIAWHKAGIMKSACPAFTVDQVPEAMEVLSKRAIEKDVKLVTLVTNPALKDIKLRPNEEFQRMNASLAIELSATVLERLGINTDRSQNQLPKEFVEGLENISWRGRCETTTTGKQHWYLDGAHNEQSLEVACGWFGRVVQQHTEYVGEPPTPS
jgi:folylpolyglutamate synthase